MKVDRHFFPAQEYENMNKKITTNSIMKSRKFDDKSGSIIRYFERYSTSVQKNDIELRGLSCLTNEVLYWSKQEDS